MSTHRQRNLAKMTETIVGPDLPEGVDIFTPFTGIVDLPDGSILVKTTTTSEKPDAEREIADFEPMRDAIRDFMENSAELREMHKGGKKGGVLEATFDDELRKTDATVHVTDPVAVQKVRDGHYTGVSWGGKKWVGPWVQTAMGKVRHIVKAVVNELSLADRPANSDALLAKSERDVLVLAKRKEPTMAEAAKVAPEAADTYVDEAGTPVPSPLVKVVNKTNIAKDVSTVDKKALRKASKLAKAQIATAKLEKKAARLAKKKIKPEDAHAALDAIGAAHDAASGAIGEAHDAIDAAAADGKDDGDDDLAKVARKELAKAQKAKTRELRKAARAARKTIRMAKLAKTIRRAASKSKSLSKVGKAISASNAGIIDSIHDSAVALGSQKCMAKAATGTLMDPAVAANAGAANGLAPATAPGATMSKSDSVFDALMERISNEISAPLAQQLTSAKAEILTDLGSRLAKVEKMPAGGGPLTAPARGGPEGDQTEAAILAKAADRYAKGSIEREALGKVAATSEIAGLQQGR